MEHYFVVNGKTLSASQVEAALEELEELRKRQAGKSAARVRGGWTYLCDEHEIALFALMSYHRENTAQPYGAPESLRFIGRVPEPIKKAVIDFSEYRRGKHSNHVDEWERMKIFSDHTFHGVAMTMENAAIVVDVAKRYFS